MPEYFSVKNFESYQRYKDRLPPWIKLHYALLEDAAWMLLDEVQQCRYMKLLLVASRCDNRILNDQTYLKNMLRVHSDIDLTPLFHSGFLVTFGAKKCRDRGPKLALSVHRETESLKKDSSETESLKKDSKRQIAQSDSDWLATLKTNPAYTGIDIEKELAKMDAWLSTPKGRGRKRTRGFVVNWLNKIDKPMASAPVKTRKYFVMPTTEEHP